VKIAILFDGASALAANPDLLILQTVEGIEAALTPAGHDVIRLPVHPDGQWIERVRKGRFDLVFNMCEGIDGVSALEPSVIALLELMGIPYTGSSSYTTSLTLRKHVVNAVLESAGLPVPHFTTIRRGEKPRAVGFPAICKPAAEDGSVGIAQNSVVRTRRALADRLESMLTGWDEVLVQRYVQGREVNVGILGDTVLPISEIDFGGMPKGLWHIVSYRSKWDTGSVEDLGAAPRCPARLKPALAAEIRRISMAAWRLVGGYGYGRVDVRIDAEGRPWILEVNANPDIAPDAGLAGMAEVAGLSYANLILAICQLGLRRRAAVESADEKWAVAYRLSGMKDAGMAIPDRNLFDNVG
jgi:D-alanine-D-alanine ligase